MLLLAPSRRAAIFERLASVQHVELANDRRFQELFVEFMQLGAQTSTSPPVLGGDNVSER
jgi:hypothetical protein